MKQGNLYKKWLVSRCLVYINLTDIVSNRSLNLRKCMLSIVLQSVIKCVKVPGYTSETTPMHHPEQCSPKCGAFIINGVEYLLVEELGQATSGYCLTDPR